MRKQVNKKKSLNAVGNLPVFASWDMSPPDGFFYTGAVLKNKISA